jgi:hypothetical protein
MRRNPRDWRIEDIILVAKKYNLLMRAEGGSHHVFSAPGIRESVTMPVHRPIKPIYIKLFVELTDKVKG